MYGEQFFTQHDTLVGRSAQRVLPLVLDLLRPASVVDVGCGSGVWLAEAARLGIEDYQGVDGYTPAESLRIPADRFQIHDLSVPLRLDRRFDLVMCLEVAEHLDASVADGLVESLTRLGPVVLFSAAVPHQGGTGHVNEQFPEYWVERFAARGYAAVDAVRPAIWTDDDVAWWYRQNVLLMCAEDLLEREPALRELREATRDAQLAVIHPHLYLSRSHEHRQARGELEREPGVRELLGMLRPAAAAAARRRLRRG